MQLASLSPDVIAIAVLGFSAFYGMVWGAPGVRALVLGSVASGLAVQQLAPMIHANPAWAVALGLFALILLLLIFSTERPHRHGRSLVAFVGGALAGAVVVACAISALPADSQKWLMSGSLIMMEITTFHWQILAGGLVLGILIPALYKKPRRDHH
jgi:hypothetical protein